MPTSLDAEHTAKLEAARALQSTLENTRLHLIEYRDQFDSQQNSGESEIAQLFEGRAGLTDPAIVGVHSAAQMTFLRKLKVQYLEQKAKDQYIKTIVSDVAPNINAGDNENLRLANERKKEALRMAKSRLAEKDSDIRKLAPLVEQDFNKAKALTSEAADLAKKILDARLQLTRLRQAYPHPRLTVQSAKTRLDEQITEMQDLADEMQNINKKSDRVKSEVKEGAREVERLRVERAELEKQARAGERDVKDPRVVGLCNWFNSSLKLHRSLHSLESYRSASENELHLTYSITPTNAPGAAPRKVRFILLFVPNTWQLADVQIEGLAGDAGDVVAAHIQSNDVPGLIASVLSRARAGL
ncbi:uncharacterized protein LAESUDRAFT_735107 [Laetiporus sulphureus 93-53]|uniref:Kinetochore protein Sos7 coiled-coil domain-containing protein n=1 Tax=Laetiporus sulphureus 93-53 TaxID=1314785 RepID=A0A165GC58_9APHY|nr:uncharacterized protein LAESUDRAFT_735107 [Laetiporus sulphureus 93-53]KZT10142.1 hypothetical protein LAESUDRAFT_735107 [Laetiporus sulphureus 93-53]